MRIAKITKLAAIIARAFLFQMDTSTAQSYTCL